MTKVETFFLKNFITLYCVEYKKTLPFNSNACLLHNLILYYDYICSNSKEELYFEEINDMILRAKELKSINNYFLIPERNVNVDILLNKIKEKIKGCVR